MQIEIRELAEKLGAETINPLPDDGVINSLAALSDAGPEDLSFFHHHRYLDDLKATCAGAVLVARDFNEDVSHVPLLKVDSPSLAFDAAGRGWEIYFLESTTTPSGRRGHSRGGVRRVEPKL